MRPVFTIHHGAWCIAFHSSRRWSDSSFSLAVFNKRWLCSHELKHTVSCVIAEAAAVCSNSSAVKVKHSVSEQQKLISLHSLYLLCCFSTIWLSQINPSAPWAEVAVFGHATVLWPNGSGIGIDPLVCPRVDIIHSMRKQKIQQRVSRGEVCHISVFNTMENLSGEYNGISQKDRHSCFCHNALMFIHSLETWDRFLLDTWG